VSTTEPCRSGGEPLHKPPAATHRTAAFSTTPQPAFQGEEDSLKQKMQSSCRIARGAENRSQLIPVLTENTPEYPTANRLLETAVGDRPQERLEKYGSTALSDAELIAMLLRSGTAGHDVLTLSNRLMAAGGSLSGLVKWTAADFQKLKGIGTVKSLQLVTVMEIAKRIAIDRTSPEPILNRAQIVVDYLLPFVRGLAVEKFYVLCLNRKNRLIKRAEISSGTAHAALAHPREVFRTAMQESSSAIICAHNHPSGDPAPSAADLHVTQLLRDAARVVDIPFIDHIVIGLATCDPLGKGYYSFREAGLL
jgi:DNA repair protein RadC